MRDAPRTSGDTGVLEQDGYAYRYRYLRGTRRDYDPVMFIGGAFQTMRSLAKLAEVFTRYTDVILVDLPGSGDTDLPPVEVGGAFYARCVEHLLDRVDVPRVNLIGLSFGSAIAYTFAQLVPDRIANLVLMGTMSQADERIEHALQSSLDALTAFSDWANMDALPQTIRNAIEGHVREASVPHRRGNSLSIPNPVILVSATKGP